MGFFEFIAGHARKFAGFQLLMQHEVTDLLMAGSRVAGVRAKTPQGEVEVRADLVIGADGRHATTRLRAHFEVQEFGVPIDVLWMRISKSEPDPAQSLGFFDRGKLLVMLDRGDYWQCGVIIPKGALDEMKVRGLVAFREEYVLAMASFLPRTSNGVGRLVEDQELLTVQINRLRDWCREGLLCIGDAAHAMSPAGGVGINWPDWKMLWARSRTCWRRNFGRGRCRSMICERCKKETRMADPPHSADAGFCSSSNHHRQDCAEGYEGEVTVRSLVAEGVSTTSRPSSSRPASPHSGGRCASRRCTESASSAPCRS